MAFFVNMVYEDPAEHFPQQDLQNFSNLRGVIIKLYTILTTPVLFTSINLKVDKSTKLWVIQYFKQLSIFQSICGFDTFVALLSPWDKF